MASERQKYIAPRKTRFAHNYNRSQLPFFLDNLGMRDKESNQALVSIPETNFMIDCIKEDFGIPARIPVWIQWFETGSVFSEAREEAGNMAFNIHIGNKNLSFQATFNKAKNDFPGLYFDFQEISFQTIQNLF